MKNKLNSIANKYTTLIVGLVATFAVIISLIFYYSHGLITKYSDSTAHLDIPRRVTDSLTPGLVQLGGIWLPLFHILEIPLVMNDFLYHSGLAGSIISMVAFILSAIGIYKILYLFTDRKVPAIIGALAFITNANILYMGIAPMMETLLICTCIWSVFYFMKWAKTDNLWHLLISGFIIFLGTLTRYDAWAIAAAETACVFLIIILKRKPYKKAEGLTIIFGFLAVLGILLWLLYNKLIFGDPFYFAFSQYSAHGQQVQFAQQGYLPTKHNIILSTLTYTGSVLYNNGLISCSLAVIGLLFVIFYKKINLVSKLTFLLLYTTFIFNIEALYQGHAILWIPYLPPYLKSLFNVRYGILMAPAIAISIGVLGWKNKYIQIGLTILVLLQGILFYVGSDRTFSFNNIILMRDTFSTTIDKNNPVSAWIRNNCKNGYILSSAGANDASMYYSGLNMKQFISEGSGKYWTEAIHQPSKYVECIYYSPTPEDALRDKIQGNRDFINHFKLITEIQGSKFYKRV